MKYYPVNLDIKNKNCLVVGGGRVGNRKVGTLLCCGARVTVVSLEFIETLRDLAEQDNITLIQRDYQTLDLDGMFLVIGATNNEKLNRQISADAHARQMLCNIADFPEACNFILPAIVERGDLLIGISTSGQSPALAKKLKHDLSAQFGPEYDDFLQLMGALRKKLLSREHAPEAHKPLFEALINRGLLSMIKNKRPDDIRLLLQEILGDGFDPETLSIDKFLDKTN